MLGCANKVQNYLNTEERVLSEKNTPFGRNKYKIPFSSENKVFCEERMGEN